MSKNTDYAAKERAEDVAAVLSGKVMCQCCQGTGKSRRKDRGWGNRTQTDCAFCKGGRWVRLYQEYFK